MSDEYYIDDNGYYRYENTDRLVHRHIASRYVVRRKIRSNEVVHHINGNKLDNRPQNLEVMTWDEHNDLHQSQWDDDYYGDSDYGYDGSGSGYVSSGDFDWDCVWTLLKIGLFIVTFPISLIVVILWYCCKEN